MEVVGVDGFRDGWVAVVLLEGQFGGAFTANHFAEVVGAVPDAATIGVDIPIGLPATGRRRADVAVRAELGARRSTVFLTPPRRVVEQDTYASANALAKKDYGFGISKQSYALRRKILDVDSVVRTDQRIHEVHPELAFVSMSGGELASKRSYAGVRQRLGALDAAGIVLPEELGAAGKKAPRGWFETQLVNGRCVVLLDGLDEVADRRLRMRVVEWVERQMSVYGKNRFVVTSIKPSRRRTDTVCLLVMI